MCIEKFKQWQNRRKIKKIKREAEEKLVELKQTLQFMASSKILKRQRHISTKIVRKSYELLLERL